MRYDILLFVMVLATLSGLVQRWLTPRLYDRKEVVHTSHSVYRGAEIRMTVRPWVGWSLVYSRAPVLLGVPLALVWPFWETACPLGSFPIDSVGVRVTIGFISGLLVQLFRRLLFGTTTHAP